MTVDMHPVIDVQQSTEEGKPIYELTLSRANLNHLCAGCPDFDRLVGHADNGAMFCIFENPLGEMPGSFQPLPNITGYFAYMGVPFPRVPQGVTNDEFVRLARQARDSLEKEINESARIPIEEETPSGKINLGCVVMKVEESYSEVPS